MKFSELTTAVHRMEQMGCAPPANIYIAWTNPHNKQLAIRESEKRGLGSLELRTSLFIPDFVQVAESQEMEPAIYILNASAIAGSSPLDILNGEAGR